MSGIALARGMSQRQVLAYGALGLPLAMAALPVYVHVPRLYAEVSGLSLSLLGILLLASRLADAFIDPLLGTWSDRTAKRQRLILLALPLLAIGMVTLLHPPQVGAAGNGHALLDIHQPFIVTQLMAKFAGVFQLAAHGRFDLTQYFVQRVFGDGGIVAQRLQRKALALQILDQLGFEVAARAQLGHVEQRLQGDMVLVGAVGVAEVGQPTKQLLQPQQDAHTFDNGKFKADHKATATGWS